MIFFLQHLRRFSNQRQHKPKNVSGFHKTPYGMTPHLFSSFFFAQKPVIYVKRLHGCSYNPWPQYHMRCPKEHYVFSSLQYTLKNAGLFNPILG